MILYKDQAPRGSRKIQGRFLSATDDSITLKSRYGSPRTLQKSTIREVLVDIKRGWPRVQAVKPKTRITVFLHKDQDPRGSRKIKGYFHSATDDSITLQREDGQRHTFQQSAVRSVLTRRPVWKRYQGWSPWGLR